MDEAVVVVGRLEQWDGPAGKLFDLVGGALEAVHSRQRGGSVRKRCVGRVSGCRRALCRGFGDRDRAWEVSPVERVRELDLQTKLEPVGTGERQRTLEQRRRRAPVAAPEGTAACGAEPLARGEGELAVVLPELVEAACGPLQVVADQLVQLDELRPALFDPLGEAAV